MRLLYDEENRMEKCKKGYLWKSKCVKKIKKYGCVQNKKKNENIISLIK